MRYRSLHSLAEAAEDVCRDHAVCLSEQVDRCRETGLVDAAQEVANRWHGLVSLAAELRATKSDLALARDLEDLRVRLDRVLSAGEMARAAWDLHLDRRASVEDGGRVLMMTDKQEPPGASTPEGSTNPTCGSQDQNGCNSDGA